MEDKLSTLIQLIADPPPAAPANFSEAHESSSEPVSSHHSDSTEKRPQDEGTAASPEPGTARAQKATWVSSEAGDYEAVSAVAAEDNGAVSAVAAEDKEASIQEHEDKRHEDKRHNATDMQWTAGGTPIIEEPCPGPLPEYDPEYTMLVPYFSSSGSQGK